MNLPKPLLNPSSFFAPALSYISSQRPHTRDPSIDDSSKMGLTRHLSRDSSSSADLDSNGIPLIDFSRTPSPNPYRARQSGSGSGAVSEDEDFDADIPLSLRPLVDEHPERKRLWKSGGLGAFLFGTWAGWQVYVGVLVLYVSCVSYVLVLLNRFILWTGVYKFPYPVTVTWMQLIGTHFWLLLSASLTRALANPLRSLGLSVIVAPSHPASSRPPTYRVGRLSLNSRFASFFFTPSGGIAGGGLFEFDRKIAWTVLLLAVIYAGKVVLSSVSYAYGVINLYTMARIGNVPLTLLFTSAFTRTTHSISTLSSTLIVTINLFVATFQRSTRVTWESIVAGIFSTLFVALYPIVLLRTHRLLASAQVPQRDLLNGHTSGHENQSGTKEASRAYWQLLHYTSLLSIAIVFPLVLISGELSAILRNCYFLDVPWFWFLVSCSSLAGWAVFTSTLALVRATSPLTMNFLSLPRGAVQITVLNQGKMMPHAWVGVSLCWAGSVWYTLVRREEGRKWEQRRMARR